LRELNVSFHQGLPSHYGTFAEAPDLERMESQWAAIGAIAAKFGCSAETLRKWIRQAERDQGVRPGLTTAERERLRILERENRELKRANEILRKASRSARSSSEICRARGRERRGFLASPRAPAP
jgi:transposase-like protein